MYRCGQLRIVQLVSGQIIAHEECVGGAVISDSSTRAFRSTQNHE